MGRWSMNRAAAVSALSLVAWSLIGSGASAVAQSGSAASGGVRIVSSFEGGHLDSFRTKGATAFVADPVRYGLAALRCAKGDGKYWGVQFDRLDARNATALEGSIFHEGKKRAWITAFVQDTAKARGADRLIQRIDINPGWNTFRVALAGAKVKSGKRELDCSKPLYRVSLERGGPPDAFVLDGLRLVLAPTANEKRAVAAFKKGIRQKDAEAAALAPPLLDGLPEAKRIPLLVRALDVDQPAAVRRALLAALRRCESEAVVKALEKKRGRRRDRLALAIIDSLGQVAAPAGRKRALAIAVDRSAPTAHRAVALRSYVRPGRLDNVHAVSRIGVDAPFALKAAAVHALLQARRPEAVDGLIAMLEYVEHPRLRLDIYEALVRLTRMDFGYEILQWKGWWAKNRDIALGGGTPGRAGGYARFYGLPVRGARLVFILDVSGSMKEPIKSKRAQEYIASAKHLAGRELATRLDLAKAELAHVLDQLPPATRFNVGFFNDEVFWLHRDLVHAKPKVIADTKKRIGSIGAGQKTNVYDALRESLDAGWARGTTGRKGGPDTVFLLSDGAPSAGAITRFVPLGDDVYERNLGRFVRINTILVGRGGGRFLRRLAEDSGGRFVNLGR